MKIDEFNEVWDNVLILLSPIDKILKCDKNLTISSLLYKLVVKNKDVFIKICIINLIVTFFTIFIEIRCDLLYGMWYTVKNTKFSGKGV